MGLYLATKSSRGIVNTKIAGMWLKMELGAGESPLTNKDTAIGSRCRPLEAGRFELNASLEGSTGAPLERTATVERSALLADAKISTVRQDLGYLPVAPFDSRCPRSVARAGYFSAQECGAVGAGFASMEYETSGEHSSLGSARATLQVDRIDRAGSVCDESDIDSDCREAEVVEWPPGKGFEPDLENAWLKLWEFFLPRRLKRWHTEMMQELKWVVSRSDAKLPGGSVDVVSADGSVQIGGGGKEAATARTTAATADQEVELGVGLVNGGCDSECDSDSAGGSDVVRLKICRESEMSAQRLSA